MTSTECKRKAHFDILIMIKTKQLGIPLSESLSSFLYLGANYCIVMSDPNVPLDINLESFEQSSNSNGYHYLHGGIAVKYKDNPNFTVNEGNLNTYLTRIYGVESIIIIEVERRDNFKPVVSESRLVRRLNAEEDRIRQKVEIAKLIDCLNMVLSHLVITNERSVNIKKYCDTVLPTSN